MPKDSGDAVKCQNCGRDNGRGAEQCVVCGLPLEMDVKRSRVRDVSSNESGSPIRLLFLATGVILLAGIAYFLSPARSSGEAPLADPTATIPPTAVDETPVSERVAPSAAVPPPAVSFSVQAGEGGSAADRPQDDTEPSELIAQGRLPREAIAAAMRRNMNEVRACYERGLKGDPTLRGVVKVVFIIGRDGKVQTAYSQDSTLLDPAVTACIVKVVSKSTFPPPEGGIVRVVYPFHFNAQ